MVRFGSNSGHSAMPGHVRYYPESRHCPRVYEYTPLVSTRPRGLHREVRPVAVAARRAIYSNFELSACHCG